MDLRDETEIEDELERALLRELGESIGPKVLDHILRPRNVGMMEDPDGQATLTGICEDTVRIQFRLREDRIDEIRFMTNGCGATIACGSMVTQLAQGKTLQEAMKLGGKTIIEAFEGLPIESTHCADLAANTLREAVKDALKNRTAPWRRLYRPRNP